MRTVVALAALCLFSAPSLVSTPSFAQSLSPPFLKKEPYVLAPWAVVYVQTSSCGVGKVMKVTGALGALRRKKACVPMGPEQASRAVAIP